MDRKRSKGRRLGSSRKNLVKESYPDDVTRESNPDDQQPDSALSNADDPIFKEIKEKIQSLFPEDGSTSGILISRNDMQVSEHKWNTNYNVGTNQGSPVDLLYSKRNTITWMKKNLHRLLLFYPKYPELEFQCSHNYIFLQKVSGVVFFGVEELELLFDELNTEDKEYLTYDEFTSGLKNLIEAGSSQWDQKRKRKSKKRMTEFSRVPSMEEADTEEMKQFKSFMEHLGANNIFEIETEIWRLWTKVNREEPRLLENLEEVLTKVTSQIKQVKTEKETLEIMLKKKIVEHNEEVHNLYEEMEQQMQEEIKRSTRKSDTRSSIHNQEMKIVIEQKNKEVQQLVAIQEELELKLHKLRSTEQLTKLENEKLKRANLDLENHLAKIRGQLSETQGCLSEMREKIIQAEIESAATNKEEVVAINIPNPQFYQIFFQDSAQKDQHKESEPETKDPLESREHRQNISNYTDDLKTSRSRVISIEEDPMPECMLKDYKLLEDCIKEEGTSYGFTSIKLFGQKGQPFTVTSEEFSESRSLTQAAKGNRLSLYSEFKSPESSNGGQGEGIMHNSTLKGELSEDTEHAHYSQSRTDMFKMNKSPLKNEGNATSKMCGNPDHVYKIMFVGNSNVGKTSFLQRAHEGSCSKDISSTIGMDYQIKALTVDNKQYLLQLWDTAGQERFHCITQQFFRKADGVVIMYDVTCTQTFTAVPYWLNLIQEKAIDDIVILLAGNKTDCESERKVTPEDAKKLAREYRLLFMECSAASGVNVTESLIQIVRSLKEHEDNMKNNVVNINRPKIHKEKNCCM
ncbi:EF-hand calcium-binding domain-containing protein 4B-like [Gastrophryne carolinensis]